MVRVYNAFSDGGVKATYWPSCVTRAGSSMTYTSYSFDRLMGVREELARAVVEGRVSTREELERLKRELAAREGLARVPTDAEVLAVIGEEVPEEAARLLVTKPSRSLSGVTVVAVMSPPARCPHGR